MQSLPEATDVGEPLNSPSKSLMWRTEGGRLSHAALPTPRPAALDANQTHVLPTALPSNWSDDAARRQATDDWVSWTRVAPMVWLQLSQVMFAMLTKAGCITLELTGPRLQDAGGPE